MTIRLFWIRNGYVETSTCELYESSDFVEEDSLFGRGCVRIVSGPAGSELKWSCHGPCYSSLAAAIELIPEIEPPYLLRCFFGGWFEEFLEDRRMCQARLRQIVLQIDKPLPAVILSKQLPLNVEMLPPLLKRIWITGEFDQELAVDCLLDKECGTFVVARVGAESAIARAFGTDPQSPPCLAFGRYARLINGSYQAALEAGDVRYEQVMASLVFPNNLRRWVPYHRLVIPHKNCNRAPAVSVVTEVSDVELKPI